MTIAFATDTFFSEPIAAPPTSEAVTSPRIRLGTIESIPCGGGRYEISATLAIGDSIIGATRLAFGPVEALTDMLYDAGFAIEITSFHQHTTEFGTATRLRCEDRGIATWATGHGDCPTLSTARAMVAAANRLH